MNQISKFDLKERSGGTLLFFIAIYLLVYKKAFSDEDTYAGQKSFKKRQAEENSLAKLDGILDLIGFGVPETLVTAPNFPNNT